MVIVESAQIVDNKVESFAWAGLRQFHNTEFTAEKHSRLLNTFANNKNVKKQASQIRDCLIQAKEYYDAASSVTLATKPVLMYYCAMSLAIAEILMKGSGDVSLDRARAEHNHHGLNFKLELSKSNIEEAERAASSLRAVPSVKFSGGLQIRFGTFELWHRGAREYPVPGQINHQIRDTFITRKSFQTILAGVDERLPQIDDRGVSLLNCIKHLPEMTSTLERFGLQPNFVRTNCSLQYSVAQGINQMSIIIQPCSDELRDRFVEAIKVAPRDFEAYNYRQFDSGGQLTIDRGIYEFDIKNTYKSQPSSMPPGMAKDTYNYTFYTEGGVPLNGFGFYLIGLFIMSNYARYYPDLWMNDIYKSSPLSIIVDDFLEAAMTTLPLLSLCELSQKYYVREGVPITS